MLTDGGAKSAIVLETLCVLSSNKRERSIGVRANLNVAGLLAGRPGYAVDRVSGRRLSRAALDAAVAIIATVVTYARDT